MKIAFLFKRDSHFKAVKSTALRLYEQYKCKAIFIGIDTTYAPDTCYNILYLKKDKLDSLNEYDYVVACLGGYLLNYVIRDLAYTQTKVISIFPGIVSHYQMDAFISRLNADQVWLNSRADYKLYRKFCKFFGRKNNGFFYGMSWIEDACLANKISSINSSDKVIFFEQTEILSSKPNKNNFEYKINEIIQMNPSLSFKYKIRNNVKDPFFLNIRKKLNDLPNVEVVYELCEKDIIESSYYISISSSALVEGILLNKLSYIIDWDLLDENSKEFFNESGMLLAYSDLSKNIYSINEKWLSNRVAKPKKKVKLIDIDKVNLKKPSIMKYRSHKFLYFILFRFSLSKIIPFRFIFRRESVSAIQKALEYLETSYEREQ